MPIRDIKAFANKWYGKPTKPDEIAKQENLAVAEVTEALEFIGRNAQIAWDLKAGMWAQMQVSKQHQYVPPPPDPNAIPTMFGPAPGKRTIAMELDTEFWDKMDRMLEAKLQAAVQKILDA